MPLPGENRQTNETFTWKARFREHCNEYRVEAYLIFCRFEIKYPVALKPEILAKQMSKLGLTTRMKQLRMTLNYEFKNGRLRITQNQTYHEVIQWLAAQLRTAAQDVPVLNNTLLNIEPLNVLGVMDAIEAHYQKLDGFGK